MKRRAAVLALACSATITACSSGTYDASATEDQIASEFTAERGTRAEAVACPVEVPLEEGFEFSCDVLTEEGDRVAVDAKMTDANGSVTWEVSGEQIDTAAVEAAIVEDLEAEGVVVTVECPGTIFAGVGDSFDCEATDSEGEVAPVIVKVDDSERGFSYEIIHE